ncbi:MAG: type II toxin-antitoxin system RelE/ParE family toxin [Oscillospiraceae bacterium]|nr:type II toxin-antitoxin system RelE/ParE family toxin [Oscillospiraceae bacterium]
MKTYEVRLTPYALTQMAEIRDYIIYHLQNSEAARNLIGEIREELMKLNQMPKRFKLVDEEPWGKRGIRKLAVKNFYAYYWVEENAAMVHVIAVTYAMRNQVNVLREIDSKQTEQ